MSVDDKEDLLTSMLAELNQPRAPPVVRVRRVPPPIPPRDYKPSVRSENIVASMEADASLPAQIDGIKRLVQLHATKLPPHGLSREVPVVLAAMRTHCTSLALLEDLVLLHRNMEKNYAKSDAHKEWREFETSLHRLAVDRLRQAEVQADPALCILFIHFVRLLGRDNTSIHRYTEKYIAYLIPLVTTLLTRTSTHPTDSETMRKLQHALFEWGHGMTFSRHVQSPQIAALAAAWFAHLTADADALCALELEEEDVQEETAAEYQSRFEFSLRCFDDICFKPKLVTRSRWLQREEDLLFSLVAHKFACSNKVLQRCLYILGNRHGCSCAQDHTVIEYAFHAASVDRRMLIPLTDSLRVNTKEPCRAMHIIEFGGLLSILDWLEQYKLDAAPLLFALVASGDKDDLEARSARLVPYRARIASVCIRVLAQSHTRRAPPVPCIGYGLGTLQRTIDVVFDDAVPRATVNAADLPDITF